MDHDAPPHRLIHVRKVIAWLNATSPYHRTWTEEEAVQYALARLVGEIESGKPSSLLNQERGWIQYCNYRRRMDADLLEKNKDGK